MNKERELVYQQLAHIFGARMDSLNLSVRESQKRYVFEVMKAYFDDVKDVRIEAGTGVGKTLSYLISSWIVSKREGVAVLISTSTKTLQDQVINKDLPLLEKLVGKSIKFCSIKGRNNYLCLVKLRRKLSDDLDVGERNGLEEMLSLFESGAWDGCLDSYSNAALAFDLKINSCSGEEQCQRCPHKEQILLARESDFIVSNHSLVLAKGFAKTFGRGPNEYMVIFDEAHNLNDGCISANLHSINLRAIHDLISSDEVVDKCDVTSLLNVHKELVTLLNVDELESNLGDFFYPNLSNSCLCDFLSKLAFLCEQVRQNSCGSERCMELSSYGEISSYLLSLIASKNSKQIWLERGNGGFIVKGVDLTSASDCLVRVVDDSLLSIRTSATLDTATADSAQRSVKIPSPFDYHKQGRIVIDMAAPSPKYTDEHSRYLQDSMYGKHLKGCGASLVLFTSRVMLERCYQSIVNEARKDGVHVWSQLKGQKSHILSEHKRVIDQGERSIIMGLTSFSEGVDLPMEYLTKVVITKLSFPSPADPIVKAIESEIQGGGGNVFDDYSIPIARRVLVQSVGRLIRTSSDEGVVVVLDIRLRNASYADKMISSLPPFPIECQE